MQCLYGQITCSWSYSRYDIPRTYGKTGWMQAMRVVNDQIQVDVTLNHVPSIAWDFGHSRHT